jgi:methylated-DNA-protein-cysteine methyltransferase-like protein
MRTSVQSTSDRRKTFDQDVFALIREIPAGRVMTYGSIARQMDPPAGMDPFAFQRIAPRWVGYALANCPADAPWHRVINYRGAISPRRGISPELQRHLLEAEGVEFNRNGKIDLAEYEWTPPEPDR